MYFGSVSSYFFYGDNRNLTYFLISAWPSGPAGINNYVSNRNYALRRFSLEKSLVLSLKEFSGVLHDII